MTVRAPTGTKHVYGEEHVRNVLMVGVFPLPYHPNVCFLFCVCICTIVIFCFNTIVFYVFFIFRFLISCVFVVFFAQDDSSFLFPRDERHDGSTQIEGQPNVMKGTKCVSALTFLNFF